MIRMNIAKRLAGIVLFSIASHHPAAAKVGVCRDQNAAIAIADLTQQAIQFDINGEDEKAARYKQMAANHAKANCFTVDSYPPEATQVDLSANKVVPMGSTKLGCRIFVGAMLGLDRTPRFVFWTRCPEPLE